jgi:hypothetical protein
MPSSPARHGTTGDASIQHHCAARTVTVVLAGFCDGAFLPALKQE